MRLPQPSGGMGRTKNIIHFVQAFVIFIAWAMTIAIWTKGGSGIDGRTAWYWVLCWFSIPGLIYLVAVPMWPRARRFGNVYAFATVDILYAVLWFSAWAAVADYVAEGKSKGASSSSDSSNSSSGSSSNSKSTRADKSSSGGSSGKSGCDNWAYGSASKCELSTATTIIGVVIFLLFAVTAYLSFRNVMHFRRTGTLPDAVSDPTFAAQSKAAFSSNPAHDFEEEDDFRSGRAGGMDNHPGSDRDEDYALLQQSEIDDMGNPNGRNALHGAYDPTAPAPAGILHDYNSSGYNPYGGPPPAQHYAPPSEYGSSMNGNIEPSIPKI
ncbi:hypothetical protein N7474_001919 [Penicillium riverlandense]|uniref:uncharacterized protein n=1 Tax=Penicillium riverlandense TaxID=1903569 RepID=UPI002547D178|nr:uncharacterized protein N7474_001919 [Penicillium riverlandense]KAJ5833608.1 hypothetical protein N7474_001919 [Penicillium riverlandense]